MVTAKSTDIGIYFNEDEVVTYEADDDLVEKVRWLLSDETRSEAIGAAGRARVLRDHTAEKRLGGVIGDLAARGWIGHPEPTGMVPKS